jgi:hypothetical protein
MGAMTEIYPIDFETVGKQLKLKLIELRRGVNYSYTILILIIYNK